jgi:type II restriction/modification system DNA methylase subunit YeeA
MNKSKLKSYAPAARREFIKAVTERANFFGLSQKHIEPIKIKGDIALIGGRAFSKDIAPQRETLEQRIQQKGFDQIMEAVAYTWFNRLVALRYMEIHGYLDHGHRVLSHPNGGHIPEILEHATNVELTGLDREKVVELKLDGRKDNDLYKMLLIGQCNELNRSMPFLFEQIQEETELLLPENLLHSNSLIQKLAKEIPEEDWQEVEIIGWLYQFYISEKKDEVINRRSVVSKEEIPAATQLFTPKWIVEYMVDNSLGRLWMLNRPGSKLIEKMGFYIKPEQSETDFLHINKPEELKICDPACGSGHMLVYAFDLLHAIYEEEGYESSEIPEKILTHNLYGIEIDDRAGELAAFALTMKARSRQRRFFGKQIQPNICMLEKIKFENDELKNYLDFVGRDLFTTQLQNTLHQFEEADNFGSLICPEVSDVKDILRILEAKDVSGQLFLNTAHQKVLKVLKQADYLCPKYHVVIANPPYMGGKAMNVRLKEFLKDNYPTSKSDLFAAFIVRNKELSVEKGQLGFVTPFVWMFISSYEELRKYLLEKLTITSLVQLEYNAFAPACIPVSTFTITNDHHSEFKGGYVRLSNFRGSENQAPKTLEAIKNPGCGWFFRASATDFKKVPGSPIAYWVSDKWLDSFSKGTAIGGIAEPRQGLATSDNQRFLRLWYEVAQDHVEYGARNHQEAKDSKARWFPYNKGGGYRKWYGNNEFFINWEDDGKELLSFAASLYGSATRTIKNIKHYFKESITWSALSSGGLSLRYNPAGFIFDTKGQCIFSDEISLKHKLMALLNSKTAYKLMEFLAPTLDFNSGVLAKVPYIDTFGQNVTLINSMVETSKTDWNSYESSWDFTRFPLLHSEYIQSTLEATYTKLHFHWGEMTLKMQRLEEENNRIFIEAYDLQEELTPVVPLKEITLTCNPHYRYSGDKNEEELEALLLTDSMKELISYAIGCMMGRYSLDQPGLVYANSENEGFDPSKYQSFLADADGIVPIMDLDWFPDDASIRFFEFLKVAWSPETLEENVRFVVESLSPKKGEIPRETIRRYLSAHFYKDHLKAYKKRPIYWLFSSGKEKAFQCLVYLHRYNESTLSRMRNEYVIPLQGKFSSRAEHLANEVEAAEATSQRNKIQKQLDALKKKQLELVEFDEELRHYADKRIALDLDDGVKVNYGKFGNLLAEVKAITGRKE